MSNYVRTTNVCERMTYDPSNPRRGVPCVSEDFWRAAIRDFEAVFLTWINGGICDEDVLTACEKFRNVYEQTQICNLDAEPTDQANGKTLGEEHQLCLHRVFCLEDIIDGDPLYQMMPGDSIDVVRQVAYAHYLNTLYRQEPDEVSVRRYAYGSSIGLSFS